jgi:hypothetical protein
MFKLFRFVLSQKFDWEWYGFNQKLKLQKRFFAQLHYFVYGLRNGHELTPLFDGNWYLHQCRELNVPLPKYAFSHYLNLGWQIELDPHPLFSSKWYLDHHSDVREANIDPLCHFLNYGIYEDRCISGWFIPSEALSLHEDCKNLHEAVRLCFSSVPLGKFAGRHDMQSPLDYLHYQV